MLISHLAYYSITTNYGGCDYLKLMGLNQIDDTLIHRALNVIVQFIYSFHMPMFISLSGALFALEWKKGKYSNYWNFLGKKALRLLIPFAFVAIVYSIPLKFATGYWNESTNIWKDMFLGQILLQGNTHLWFLPTLFALFAIFYWLAPIQKKSYRFLILMALGAISAISSVIPIKFLSYIAQYGLWFYLGYCFEEYRKEIETKSNWETLVLSSVISLVLFFVERSYQPETASIISKGFNKIFVLLISLMGMITVYGLSCQLAKVKFEKTKFARLISKHSFGLYLYSDNWNYIVLFAFYQTFGIFSFGKEGYALLLILLRFIFSGGIALGISFIIKKLKIKYIA